MTPAIEWVEPAPDAVLPRRFSLGAGAAMGPSWACGGPACERDLAASPAGTVTFSWGTSWRRSYVQVAGAPFFAYHLTDDVGTLHLATVATGVTFGNDWIQVGAGPFIGLFAVGAGARLELVHATERRRDWGVELQANYLFPSTFQGMLLLTWNWGPWGLPKPPTGPEEPPPPETIARR